MNRPKAKETSDRLGQSNFKEFRSKAAAALVMSLAAIGCQDGAVEDTVQKGMTTSTASAKSNPSNTSAGIPVEPTPEVNVCDEKLKTDTNLSKYPRASRESIQKILDKFDGAETAIESSVGNGCRDTIIFMPRGFNRSQPIELQYHFHGAFGNFIGMPVPYNTKLAKKGEYSKADMRLEQALIALSHQHKLGRRNTVLAYPLSAGRREGGEEFAYDFAYDDLWMKRGNDTNDSMTVLDFDVRNRLASEFGINTDEATVTFSGHSAGGKPIMHAVQSGFAPDKIKFLEASYRDWADNTYQEIIKKGDDVPIDIFYKPGFETARSANALYGKDNVNVTGNTRLTHGQFVELL